MPARQCLNKLFVTPKHYRRYKALRTCVFDDKTRPHKKGEFFVQELSIYHGTKNKYLGTYLIIS